MKASIIVSPVVQPSTATRARDLTLRLFFARARAQAALITSEQRGSDVSLDNLNLTMVYAERGHRTNKVIHRILQ